MTEDELVERLAPQEEVLRQMNAWWDRNYGPVDVTRKPPITDDGV